VGDLGHPVRGDPRLLHPRKQWGKDKDNLSPKGKRAAPEDAEAEARPTGQKRLKETSAGAADEPQPSEKNMLFDESEDDPLRWGGRSRRLEGTPLSFVFVFTVKFFRRD
jgi:hypothetical protein